MTVHFRPPGGYVGDLIPFERDGRLWLFYLLDERRDPPTGMPWALASTEDFVTYADHGVVLPSGGTDAPDYNCYTGCVIDDGDQLHLFYTGHNPGRRTAAGDIQVVCHATSDGDLTQWHGHPDHTFGAPEGYLPEDWRDPYVYRVTPNEPWQLILAARHTEGPDRRRGVVARLTSTDLVTWHPITPLWDPIASSPRSAPRCSSGANGGISSIRNFPTPSKPDTGSPEGPRVPGWRPDATLSTGELDTRRSRLPRTAADSFSGGSPRAKATRTMAPGNGPANWPSSRRPKKPTAPWGSDRLPTCGNLRPVGDTPTRAG